jgi:DNA-binding transcriptional LysR family regulator
MEFHQIRYFVALSQVLNFTRAAEMCNITQPALTKAVKKLEAELGGELIYREREFTQLTELGKIMLPRPEDILTSTQAARQSAEGFRLRKETALKVGLSPCVSAAVPAVLAPKALALHPALHLELVAAPGAQLFERLLAGEITVAISGDIDDLPERLDSFPLFEERLVVLASPHNPLARADPIPLGALQDQIWLDRLGCKISTRFWRQHFTSGTYPRVSHRGRHTSHLQEMIAADLGIMLAPEHTPCVGSVVARSIDGDPAKRTVYLLVTGGRRHGPALDAFIRVASDHDWGTHIQTVRNRNAAPACVNGTSAPPRHSRSGVAHGLES